MLINIFKIDAEVTGITYIEGLSKLEFYGHFIARRYSKDCDDYKKIF